MAGVKGRSGRRPNYELRNLAYLKDQALAFLTRAFNDPNCPIEFKRNCALAITLKDMTSKQEITASLLPAQELSLIAKYEPGIEQAQSKPLALTEKAQTLGVTTKEARQECAGESECGGGVGDVCIGVPPISTEIPTNGVPYTSAEKSDVGVPVDKTDGVPPAETA
jgi:hypothetical protein